MRGEDEDNYKLVNRAAAGGLVNDIKIKHACISKLAKCLALVWSAI